MITCDEKKLRRSIRRTTSVYRNNVVCQNIRNVDLGLCPCSVFTNKITNSLSWHGLASSRLVGVVYKVGYQFKCGTLPQCIAKGGFLYPWYN